MELIQPYLDYFSQNPEWALTVIFLIAFGEALLIIGLFVPSTAVLVGAGMLVGTGHLEFWPVFLATAIGAIAGDQVSYWAGRLFGDRLRTMWPLSNYQSLFLRGEDFVRSHGGKSIAIGRFVPGVKAVVPGIVGMLGMNQLYFVFVNFTSGIVWALAHVVPGVLMGQGLALAGELSGRLLVVLLVLLLTLAVAGYLVRLAAAGLSPLLSRLLADLSQWAKQRQSKFLRRLGYAIAPDNPRSVLVVAFTAVIMASLIALADIISGLVGRDAVANADLSMHTLMKEIRNAPADELMIAITMLGDGAVLTATVAAMLLWLAWRRSYRAALAAFIVFAAAQVFVPLVKYVIQRPRPVELLGGTESFSFPSAHATLAVVTFGLLAVLVSHAMGRWGRAVVYAACGIAATAIAFSRLYLGAHWLSDVLGGLLFGTAMVAAFGVAIEAIPPRRIRPLGLLAVTVIAFIGVGSLHIQRDFSHNEAVYALPQTVIDIPRAGWIGHEWRKLPQQRVDLAGRPEETFTLQYAGELPPLAAALENAGWRLTSRWSWRDALPYFDPDASLDELKPRPSLHEGLQARLTAIHPIAGAVNWRIVVRVFKTGVRIADGDAGLPLFLVSVSREELRRGLGLYAMPAPRPAAADDANSFMAALAASQKLQRLTQPQVDASGLALAIELR